MVNPRPESFGGSVSNGPDVLKGIEQSGKLFPTAKCNEVPASNHSISDIFDETQWYITRMNGRTHTFNETIDCYVKKSNNVQTTYV